MKRITFLALFLGASFIYLNSCTKEEVQPKISTVQDEEVADRKYSPVSCPLYDQYETQYSSLGFTLFGHEALDPDGTIDDHLNCPTDYWDRCNVVSEEMIYVTSFDSDPNNVNGYTHPLSDGVMSVAEQNALVTQIKNVCQNYLNANYTTSHEVIDYDVSFIYPLCCNSMSVYVDFTAATRCR